MLEGDFPAARRLQEESLAKQQQLEDEAGMAWTLSGLGELARAEGYEEEASNLLERELALARRLGEQGVCFGHGATGNAANSPRR